VSFHWQFTFHISTTTDLHRVSVVMRFALQCLLGAALLCAVSASLPTVPTLNLNQYLGHWYQVYSNPLVDTFIEGTE
jgi:lipocalin